MSILIPGMEMPTRCWDCPMCYDMMACTITGLNWYRDTVDLSIDPAEERMPNCPLIELPPHGRLVDADAMLEFVDAGHLRHPHILSWSDRDVEDMIDSRPTIIPAEGGADNG